MTGYTYHIVPRVFWEAQDESVDYRPEPMQAGREAFIHCTDGANNLADTANRHYHNVQGDFVALILDLSKVKAPIKYEDANRIYPHIYGPLNRDAIVKVVSVARVADTQDFLPPEE